MRNNISVGDIVMVVTSNYEKPRDGLVSLLHKTGIVRTIGVKIIGVEFDHSFAGGHDLQGLIATNRGWNIPSAALAKMKPIKEVFENLCKDSQTNKVEKGKNSDKQPYFDL